MKLCVYITCTFEYGRTELFPSIQVCIMSEIKTLVTAVNCHFVRCVISTMNIHYDQIWGAQKGMLDSHMTKKWLLAVVNLIDVILISP